MKKMKLFLYFIIFAKITVAQTYNGTVVDAKTKQIISFANIGIPSKGYGVVCNEQGEFNLKITTEKDTDIVQIFSIGYKPLYMPLGQLKGNLENNHVTIL